MSAVVLAVLLIFQVFIYSPKNAEKSRLMAELACRNAKIQQTQVIMGIERGAPGKGLAKLKLQLARFEERLPRQEEISEVVKRINGEAVRNKVNVISTEFRQSELFRDSQDNPVEIEGRFCKRLSVTLAMESRYEALGKYLASLQKNLPILFTIDKLVMDKMEGNADKLKVELIISVYTLAQNE